MVIDTLEDAAARCVERARGGRTGRTVSRGKWAPWIGGVLLSAGGLPIAARAADPTPPSAQIEAMAAEAAAAARSGDEPGARGAEDPAPALAPVSVSREETRPAPSTTPAAAQAVSLFPAEDEVSTDRGRRRYRGTTIGIGGQMVLAGVPACAGDGTDSCEGVPVYLRVQGTPVLDILSEFGGRRLRFLVGLFTAPVPMTFSDWGTATAIGLRAGFLAGNERIRGGASVGLGYYLSYEVNAHLFVMPWRSARGHRHGLAVATGVWNTNFSLSLGYRVAPALLNHRRRRSRHLRHNRRRMEPVALAREPPGV